MTAPTALAHRARRAGPLRAAALQAALLLVATLALALAAEPARAQGTIGLLNKERKVAPQPTPMVLGETLDSVRFRTKAGTERTEKTADIAWIDYGPGSTSFEKGAKAMAASDFATAETLFAAASKDTDPPWVAPHALLQQAQAAVRRGKEGLVPARAAIAEFLKRFPDHRLLPQALLEQARLAALEGDTASVEAPIAQALKLAADGRITPDWAARAHLVTGEMRLEEKNVGAAKVAYGEAERAAAAGRNKIADRPDLEPVLATLALQARVGTASCLLASDDVTGARTLYQQLARDGQDDAAVKAAADNGLAECDFRDPGKLKDAQLAFARVAVGAAGVPAERARALYFLGRCADALGQQNREPDGPARAAAYYEEVVKRYPDTPWGRLARQSLP